MAEIKIPVLFDCSGAATLLGESFSSDVITHHLEFDLTKVGDQDGGKYTHNSDNHLATSGDATIATTSKIGLELFSQAFQIGDTDDTADKFFYAKSNDSVRKFANTLADILIYGLYDQTSATGNGRKNVPLGGSDLVDSATPLYNAKLCAAGNTDRLYDVMARVAAVHLSGHPLAQVIFTNEDSMKTTIIQDSTNTSKQGSVLTSDLASQIYTAFGGNAMEGVGANFDSGNLKTSGILKENGTANPVLKSILEQLLKVSGRPANVASIEDPSGNDNETETGNLPFASGDKIFIYLRPKITLSLDDVDSPSPNVLKKVTTHSNGTGTSAGVMGEVAIDGTTETAATAADIDTVFPGVGGGDTDLANGDYGWMGASGNNGLTQQCTDLTDSDVLDCHIWKISITLTAL